MSRLSETDRIVCPASQSEDERGYFKKHYASAEELKDNGGVCARCRREFEKRYASQTARRNAEPAAFHFARGVKYVDGHPEPVVDTDDAATELAGEALPLVMDESDAVDESAVNAIAKFCRNIFQRTPDSVREATTFWHAAHAITFAAHLHPAQHLSGEQIAAAIGMEKEAFLKLVQQYRDRDGLARIGGSWKKESRKKHRETIKATHVKRKIEKRKIHREVRETNRTFTRQFGAALKAA